MDSIGAGNFRDQARRDLAVYEDRLNALATERDSRAEEAVKAQERFAFAMTQISEMQSTLLASEDRRKELETGLDVVQKTLRRTMRERDEARGEATELALALATEPGSVRAESARSNDVEATLAYLTDALGATAGERDDIARVARQTQSEYEMAMLERRLLEERNDAIFQQLEEAVSISMEPLDTMFRAAGLQPDRLIDQVRRGYSGAEGPLTPISFSTKGDLESPEELRANAILQGLDRMNMYRIAAQKAPFANPTRAAVRFTSGFGTRRDPKTGGRRMHSGLDFAGPHGTAIHATADGVVKLARSHGGYGRTVIIQHEFGIETLYAHMSQIRVNEGQRVSRGDRIGDMGNTGRSTGTHLHYEVRLGGTAVNPMTYIKAARNVF
jgi:murein DD-endopeptidase MepM/ murein hydrolase activator NlpD